MRAGRAAAAARLVVARLSLGAAGRHVLASSSRVDAREVKISSLQPGHSKRSFRLLFSQNSSVFQPNYSPISPTPRVYISRTSGNERAQPVVTVCLNSDVSRTRYSTSITVRCSPCLSDWRPVEEMFDIDHRCSSTNEVAQYVFIKPQPTRQLLPATVRSSTKRPQCPCVFVDSEDERYMMLVLRSQFYHVVRRWPCLSGW